MQGWPKVWRSLGVTENCRGQAKEEIGALQLGRLGYKRDGGTHGHTN